MASSAAVRATARAAKPDHERADVVDPAAAAIDTGRMARAFQALSDEKRLRILALLRMGERCVCELTEALDAPQSLLSFHLKTLKDAELVSARRQGRWMYYSANTRVLAGLEAALGGLAPADEGWRSCEVDGCCE